jgi:hypothetical protein
VPYINESNVYKAYALAGAVTVILLIVCVVKCCINNPRTIHLKELKKLRPQKYAIRDENRRICEENDRIKSEWERKTGALKSKLGSLKTQAAQYSELYSIWDKCADEIRHDYYIYDWEWNLPDDNFTLINHLLTCFLVLENRYKQPMSVLDIVCMAKEKETTGMIEAHERLKRRGVI